MDREAVGHRGVFVNNRVVSEVGGSLFLHQLEADILLFVGAGQLLCWGNNVIFWGGVKVVGAADTEDVILLDSKRIGRLGSGS